jgi:hypothetical protein
MVLNKNGKLIFAKKQRFSSNATSQNGNWKIEVAFGRGRNEEQQLDRQQRHLYRHRAT